MKIKKKEIMLGLLLACCPILSLSSEDQKETWEVNKEIIEYLLSAETPRKGDEWKLQANSCYYNSIGIWKSTFLTNLSSKDSMGQIFKYLGNTGWTLTQQWTWSEERGSWESRWNLARTDLNVVVRDPKKRKYKTEVVLVVTKL